MPIQDNVQIVKDFFAAMGSGDQQGLLALSAEDIEWVKRGYAGGACSSTFSISRPEKGARHWSL